MKSQRITNASIFYAFVSGLLLAGAIGIRILRPVSAVINDPILNSLTTQAADLRQFDELALGRSVEQLNAAKDRLWTTEAVNELANRANASGWRLQAIGSTDSVFTTDQRFLLRRTDLTFQSWPSLARFLSDTARAAGVRIESVTIEAQPGAKRAFTSLEAVLSLPQPKPEVETQPTES